MIQDPVCFRWVEEKTAPHHTAYGGQTYYFCSPECHTKFGEDPARTLRESHRREEAADIQSP